MSAELVLTPQGLQQFFKELESVLSGPLDFTGYFDRAELALKTAALNCFDQGVDPNGNPWAPVKFRVRDSGGTLQPLRDRGLLMASMTSDSGSGAIRERGNDFLRYGTNLIYAGVHQFGHRMTPKQASFLCMPMTLEALRAGSPKNFPRPLRPVINKSKDGGVLIEDEPKDQEPKKKGERQEKPNDIVHYIMTKEAVIPARPFLGYTEKLADKMALILDDWLHGPEGPYGKFFKPAA